MNTIQDTKNSFEHLLTIMNDLREKCPWDKKQTKESLSHLTIEEVYELVDAISDNDYTEIKKELGDVILHIVFYSKMASEKNKFDIKDVLDSVCEKLIYRHPHIYSDTKAETVEDVKRNWEKLKLKENKEKKTLLSGVPKSLPAMVKAYRIQDKVQSVGFDFENKKDAFAKVKEEILEFENEVENKNIENSEKEFGDILFSLINYARFVGINPEEALNKTNKKFIKRFNFIESNADKDLYEMSLSEMENLWIKAKKELL